MKKVMLIAERMSENTASCGARDSLDVAANLLWQNDCGCLPVVDESGQVHGMLTDRDICMAAMTTGKRLAELCVGDTMARDVASIGPTESLQAAEMVMRDKGVHRLPVIDAQRHLLGMLCCNDLLRWVDDGGANRSTAEDAVHLIHTLATVGKPRTGVRVPAKDRDADRARSVDLPAPGPESALAPALLGASRRDGLPGPRRAR